MISSWFFANLIPHKNEGHALCGNADFIVIASKLYKTAYISMSYDTNAIDVFLFLNAFLIASSSSMHSCKKL